MTGGSIVGDMAPYQAFTIGGLGSVRGYGEGAVGSGRLCMVANSELTFPLVCKINTFCFLASPNVYENDVIYILFFKPSTCAPAGCSKLLSIL